MRSIHIYAILVLLASSLTRAAPPASTAILDPAPYLTAANIGPDMDTSWYRQDIPFFDCPDEDGGEQIRQIYYYRWRLLKSHMRHTAQSGIVFTEFIAGDNWRAKDPFVKNSYSAINAGAGFVIDEARWLRDGRPARDYIRHFIGGYGRQIEYTDWLADAVYAHYLSTGDAGFTGELLSNLVSLYNLRKATDYNEGKGLFLTSPIVDAMENNSTARKYGNKVRTYRPTYESYMYANAMAIAAIAQLVNEPSIQARFELEAKSLKQAMHKELWNQEKGIFMEKLGDGTTWAPAVELIGFAPWAFHAADDQENYAGAWKYLFDPNGFNGPYGLRTTVKDSPSYFAGSRANECWWNGPSWPFTTSMTLVGMANVLNDYQHQGAVTIAAYQEQFLKFTRQQYKNGVPYVAESYDPDKGVWLCDIAGRSEDYLHSKYIDLLITGLVGLRPGNETSVNPLTPKSWSHWCLENVPYQGHLLSIVYDRRKDGDRYKNAGTEIKSGLTVYVDGNVSAHADTLQRLNLKLDRRVITYPEGDNNYAFRDSRFTGKEGFPRITSSSQGEGDLWQLIDGNVLYHEKSPINRFSFRGSANSSDYVLIDLGDNKPITNVALYFYDDAKTLRCPTSYQIEYATKESPEKFIPIQTSTSPVANAASYCTFKKIDAQKWRIHFVHAPDSRTALTEISLNGPPLGTWEAEAFADSGDVSPSPRASGGAYVGADSLKTKGMVVAGITVPNAGYYTVRLRYANGQKVPALIDLQINEKSQRLELSPTGGWADQPGGNWNFAHTDVFLKSGDNTIRLADGLADIDCIRVLVPDSYRDQFINDRTGSEASGWIGYSGAWLIRDKKLTVDKGADQKAILALNTGNYTHYRDMIFSADIRPGSNTGRVGLIFKVSKISAGENGFTGWYAGFEGDKIVLGHADGATFTQVAESPFNKKSDAATRIRLECRSEVNGDVIKIYANGDIDPLIVYQDERHLHGSGYVGLRACDTAAEFNNIEVTNIPPINKD